MDNDQRFIDMGDGTIKDTQTNLLWIKNDSFQDLNQFVAFYSSQRITVQKYIDKKNNEKFAGYSDWRLPTKQEALTLYEPESMIKDKYDMDIHLNPVFPEGGGFDTWTSNTRGKITAYVFSYNSGTGGHQEVDNTMNTSVRLVRSDGETKDLPKKVPPTKVAASKPGSWR